MREVPPVLGLPAVKQNVIDRMVEWWNPVRGAERLRARVATAMMSGGYNSGSSKSKRSMAGWNANSGSADALLVPDLPTLWDRSRELVRDNPLACGAINTMVTRVVGTGLSMHPAIDGSSLGLTPDQVDAWQETTSQRWRMWAESTWCDAGRTLNFYGQQNLAMREALEGGDCFALLPMIADRSRPSELAIMLLNAERVANPRGKTDTRDMCAGIQRDSNGAPIRCHILRESKGSIQRRNLSGEGDWIDFYGGTTGRRNVLHVMDPRRIGQTRGAPYLAPVIESLKQLGRYSEAELSAAVLSAFFTVFVRHPAGEGLSPLDSAQTGDYQKSDVSSAVWDGKLSPGLAVDLPPGAEIETANPGRPNEAFDPFVQAVMRQIGVALEIPFELLIKHFTSSYTAARAALLDFWLVVRYRREWMTAMFCQPIYEEWLRIEVATGRIAAPGFFSDLLVRHAWCSATWTGDAMGVLDPQREISATEKALELKLTTRASETMLRDGTNFNDNIEQLAREEAAMDRLGLKAAAPKLNPPAPTPDAANPQPGDTPPADQNQDGSDVET